MDFEELPNLWQKAVGDFAPPEAVLAEVVDCARRLERDVRRRDLIESGISLALAPLFGVCVFLGRHPVAQAGAAILAVSCLLIPLRLRAARRHFERVLPDRSLRNFLLAEQERVRAQVRLLRSVLWWYLLPLGVGVVLLFGGGIRSWPLALSYAAIVIALYGWIFGLNQRAVADELTPRLDRLGALLAALDGPVEP